LVDTHAPGFFKSNQDLALSCLYIFISCRREEDEAPIDSTPVLLTPPSFFPHSRPRTAAAEDLIFFFSDFYYYRIQMPAIQVPSRRFPWPFFPRSLYHDGDARERKEKKIGGADRPTGPRCDDPAPSRTGGSLSSKCSLWSTAYAPGALHVHGLYGKTFRAEPGGIIFCIRTSLISPCI
jgi:hypothetical protein